MCSTKPRGGDALAPTATLSAPTIAADGEAIVSDTFTPMTDMTLHIITADGNSPVLPLPGPSKGPHFKQRPGYHPPRPFRRPQRHAKLQACKAIARDQSISSKVPVPEQVQQIRQTASAVLLASQSKVSTSRRCRDSVEVLLEEAEAMQPQQAVRTRRHIDNVLLSNKEVPGARHAYRMSQSIALDYNNNSNEFLSENMLVSVDFLDMLYKCTTICNKCQHHL